MTLTKGFIRNAAKTPLDQRLADMATLVCNSDGSPRSGVLGAAGNIVTTLGTMHLAVAAAEFATSKGKADGVAIFTNDGVVNVPITAAPVSNSRITTLWVKHNDDTTGDANALPVFGTTDGAAAAVPVAPALPTGALELAQLRIYSGTTATNGGANVLTNTYRTTAPRNAVVSFRTKAELDLWTNPVVGQRARVEATGATYERFAGAWAQEFGPTEAYAPVWTATNLAPSLGNGALTGRSALVGLKSLWFRIDLLFGSTTSGGAGDWTFSLPAPAHGTGRQVVMAVATLAGPGWTFFGGATIEPGASVCTPRFPQTTALTVTSPARNADAGGGGGTGIPNAGGGNYSYVAGSRVVIEGTIELA